jgi:hypothetical protein
MFKILACERALEVIACNLFYAINPLSYYFIFILRAVAADFYQQFKKKSAAIDLSIVLSSAHIQMT